MSDPEREVSTNTTGVQPLIEPMAEAHRLGKSGWLWRIVEALLAIGILGMLVMLSIQVVARLVGTSPPWTEEIARFLFMDGVFLGMAAGFRAAAHPRVSSLVARGPMWLAKLSLHVTVGTAVFFFGILTWKTIELIIQQMRSSETSPALGVNMWLVTLPLAIGGVLSVIGTIQAVYFDKGLRRRLLRGEVIA